MSRKPIFASPQGQLLVYQQSYAYRSGQDKVETNAKEAEKSKPQPYGLVQIGFTGFTGFTGLLGCSRCDRRTL